MPPAPRLTSAACHILPTIHTLVNDAWCALPTQQCMHRSGPWSHLASPEASQQRSVGPTNAFVPFRQEEIEQSIPARFEQQVQRYPDRQALRSGHQTLTYEALNRTANRLAHAILAQRPGGKEPVALLLEHGIPMITGMLGTLKAGKIYVPLDPSFRRAHHLHGAGCRGTVYCDRRCASTLGAQVGPTRTACAQY